MNILVNGVQNIFVSQQLQNISPGWTMKIMHDQ